MASQVGIFAPRITTPREWPDALGALFRRYAIFRLDGTVARLERTASIPEDVIGLEVSLVERTPLRTAIEAASPVIGSGYDPSAIQLTERLGITPGRAYAVIPLLDRGAVVALAYGDRLVEPLSVECAQRIFALYDESDVSQSPRTEDEPPQPRPIPRRRRSRRPHHLRARLARRVELALEEDEQDVVSAPPLDVATPDFDLEELLDFVIPDNANASHHTPDLPENKASDDNDETLPPWAHQTRALLDDDAWEMGTWQRTPAETSGETIAFDPLPPAPPAEPEPRVVAIALPESVPTAPRPLPEEATPELELPEWHSTETTSPATLQQTLERTVRAEPPAPKSVRVSRLEGPPGEARGERRHRSRLALASLFAVAALIGVAISATLSQVLPPSYEETSTTLVIPDGEGLASIALRLEGAGIVRSAFAFRQAAKLLGVDRGIRAGRYELPRNRFVWEVAETLQRGHVELRTVTIPEGTTVVDVAAALHQASLVDKDEFFQLAHDRELLEHLGIPGPSAEGYLFPETYQFAVGLSSEEILTLMVEQTRRELAAFERELNGEEIHTLLTLASIVERETKSPSELARISGVFHNRLESDMRLESCATVQYILGEPKAKLTVDDVRIPDPFNTYLHEGLPPAPIANPGRGAIEAALHPEEHDFRFFVAKGDGTHIFTKSYEAHKAAKARYQP